MTATAPIVPVGAIDSEKLPDRAFYDGQRTLGFAYVSEDGGVAAFGPAGEPLGTFSKMDEARAAVIANAGSNQHG